MSSIHRLTPAHKDGDSLEDFVTGNVFHFLHKDLTCTF